MRRKPHSFPARYVRVLTLVVVFSAVLTLMMLLDPPSVIDEQMTPSATDDDEQMKPSATSATNKPMTKQEKARLAFSARQEAREEREANKKQQERAIVLDQLKYRAIILDREWEANKYAKNLDRFKWSVTTKAFLPVMTKERFKLYVDTFRSALFCFHQNGLHLLPTGGTLVGTLRHKGMIPWDDDIDVYYFVKDANAILAQDGPVQKCLKERGITNMYYHENNIRFIVDGYHIISAFPAYHTTKLKKNQITSLSQGISIPAYHKTGYIDFLSQGEERRRSTMLETDIFPLTKMPFHDYEVYLPHNIEKYIEVDWGKNQVDKIKTPTYESLMSTVISGHLHRGCKRAPVQAHISHVEFLKYYDPEEYENSLPFPTRRCSEKIHPRFYS